MTMRNSIALLLATATCLDIVSSQKVVPVQFAKTHHKIVNSVKRDTVNVELGNAQHGSSGLGIYYANVTIGTPGQLVQLQLDTGSSDLWMFSNVACESDDVMCLGGVFNPNKSSTFSELAPGEFNISYVTPGSGVHGDYIQDDCNVGGVTVHNLTMGLALTAKQVPTGIMGIGYKENEALFVQSGGQVDYPNIVDMMQNQSLIHTRAYSLFLDDRAESTGTILFGGYDTEKFSGTLSLLDIQPDENGEITSFSVAWTGFSISTPGSGTTTLTDAQFAQPVVLDSGTTLTVLPSQLALQLVDAAGAQFDDQSGVYLLLCSSANDSATLSYQFGGADGPIINVPFSELVLPVQDTNGQPLQTDDGEDICLFGIKPAEEDDVLLFGDTFLRSAYVVYDLDGQKIGIAQAVSGTEKSNIVEITTTLGSNLKGVSVVSSQAVATQTATSKDVGGAIGTGAATSDFASPTANNGGNPSFTLGPAASNSASSGRASSTPTSTSKSAATTVPAFEFASIMVVMGSLLMAVVGGLFVAL